MVVFCWCVYMKDNLSSFETGFSATIRGISLFDYLQLLIMTKKDKTIEIRSHEFLGLIQLVNGKVIFSKTSSGKSGNKAFCQILSWKNGAFKDVDTNKVLKENIVDKGNLLLQAAEYIDELEKNLKENSRNKEVVTETKNFNADCERAIGSLREDDVLSILEYEPNKTQNTSDCKFFEICELFDNCRSEGIKKMWIRVYCKTKKQEDCKRYILINKNEKVSGILLPNGNLLE